MKVHSFAQDDGNPVPGITAIGNRHQCVATASTGRTGAVIATVEEVASWVLIAALIREAHQTFRWKPRRRL